MNLRDVDEYLRKQDADADPNEMFMSDNPVQGWDDQKWSESNDDDENIVTSTFMDKTIPSTSDEKAPPVPKPSSNEAKLDHSEICDLMLESNIFAAIDRKLYVWDKNFYRFYRLGGLFPTGA